MVCEQACVTQTCSLSISGKFVIDLTQGKMRQTSACRETINITKRILIRGCGPLRETKVDQRANCPIFRITRSAVIMNLEIDMTGFREAVLITGTDKVCPGIQNCTIR